MENEMNIDGKYHFLAVNKCTGNSFDQTEGVCFRVHDAALPAVISAYINACKALGADDGQILGCEKLRERVMKWQSEHDVKVPDGVNDCELDHVVNSK
jgi:hypothetical protein